MERCTKVPLEMYHVENGMQNVCQGFNVFNCPISSTTTICSRLVVLITTDEMAKWQLNPKP